MWSECPTGGERVATLSKVTASDLLAEKIPDAELQRLAHEASDEQVSVIIELAVPDPEVEYAHVNRQGENVALPVRVAPQTEQERANLDDVSSDAKRFLEDLLSEPPVYLQSAQAFIARATGKELDLIARRPFTKRIEPNRRLPR